MSDFFMSLLGSFMAPKVLAALAGVLALILLDFILGALVSMKARTFDVRKLPQFLETSFVPYAGGLLILALFSNTDPTLSVLFLVIATAVYAKFLADIKDKVAALFAGITFQVHNPIEIDHATKPVAVSPAPAQPVIANAIPSAPAEATEVHPAILQAVQLIQQAIAQPTTVALVTETPAAAPVAQPAV